MTLRFAVWLPDAQPTHPHGSAATARASLRHIVVGVELDAIKHVLGICVQATEGAKFWAGVCAERRKPRDPRRADRVLRRADRVPRGDRGDLSRSLGRRPSSGVDASARRSGPVPAERRSSPPTASASSPRSSPAPVGDPACPAPSGIDAGGKHRSHCSRCLASRSALDAGSGGR